MKAQLKRMFALLLVTLMITNSQSTACASLASYALGAKGVYASEVQEEVSTDAVGRAEEDDDSALKEDENTSLDGENQSSEDQEDQAVPDQDEQQSEEQDDQYGDSSEKEEVEEDIRKDCIMKVKLYENNNEYLLCFDKCEGDLEEFYENFLKIKNIIQGIFNK